jgi:glycosyltransferase involved in cell wall biosynthesis
MRILVVTNGYPPRGWWGTEFYTTQMVGGLRAAGHEVAVLHPERSGGRPRYTVELEAGTDGTPVFLLHNPGDSDKSFVDSYENGEVERRFAELIDHWRPDLVHFTYLLWGLSVRMVEIARDKGVATEATLTDYGLLCHRGQMYDWTLKRCEGPHSASVCARCIRTPSRFDAGPLELVAKRAAISTLATVGGAGRVVVASDVERRQERMRAALSAVDELIAPTRVLKRKFVDFGVPEYKLTELVYSIDERPLQAARPEPPRDRVVFGFLGQFTPHKGLDVLIEAVRIAETRLPESVIGWVVRLYGKPAGGRHRRFADAVLGGPLGPRIEVMEPFSPDRAPEVLRGLHAIVIPSEWDENAPLTCLQARAAGIPIVGTRVAGIEEVVTDGEHGVLVDVEDAEALADALREVILGRVRRHPEPRLPMPLDAHVQRLGAVHTRALERAAARR